MSGSWENKINVLGAILHVESTSIAWAFGFRNLLPYGMPFLPVTGMPYDMARNHACMMALQHGFSHLFFYDSDVIAPKDAVLRLLAHNKPIVSGLYYRRSPPHGLPVMIKNGTWFTDYVPGSTVAVDMVGAGCLLLSRELLEKSPPQRPGHHWFDWRVNYKNMSIPDFPDDRNLSEDFSYNVWIKRQLGITTYVDTSIECRHAGFSQAVRGNMLPLEVVS